MLRLPRMRLALALPVLLAALLPVLMVAQDDPNDTPLGDVARSLRQKAPASRKTADDVIDNDNLSNVMDQAESRHAPGSVLKFLMGGEDKGFQVSAPDVTCSLAFTANVKSLLSSQYAQMELPPSEVRKLEGPATVEGDALLVSVFNGTEWHVSEVAVALTIVKKGGPRDASLFNGTAFYDATLDGATSYATAKPLPADTPPQESEVRPEKKPDTTVIYRMRAAAPPLAVTVFSAPLNPGLAPGEEWHWAILQAKGYPPQSYAGNTPQATAQTNEPALIQPALSPPLLAPQNSPAVSLPRPPQ